ncbi:OTU protein [Pestalotiopsis sp. IQ-011]
MADPSTCPPLTRASVVAAHDLIRPYVHHTPTLTNATLTRLASTPRTRAELAGSEWEGQEDGSAAPTIRLWFKCENLQRIGAFKVRGAFRNHAQALALAARTNGIPAYIVMPSISPPPKIAATRGYGANVIFSGSTSVEREAVCAGVIQETGARLVPPYDHPDIVLGQGTLGLELQEDAAAMMAEAAKAEERELGNGQRQGGRCSFAAPVTLEGRGQDGGNKTGLDMILAPCGGGGMLSGVALSCEDTGIRVFGCEPSFEGADDAKRGFYSEDRKRIEAVKTLTVADGLRTPVGAVPWSVIRERGLVEGFYSVTEQEIKSALRLVLERFKMVVEPSACVPLAVALYNEDFRTLVQREYGEGGANVGVVFSGGNLDLDVLARIVTEGKSETETK